MSSFRSGFVAVVGPANAGKSTLVNRLVGEKISIVSPKAQTTRNRILGIKTTDTAQLVLIDTPGYFPDDGQEKPVRRGALEQTLREVSADSLSGVDQIMLVLDAERAVRHHGYLDSVLNTLNRNSGVQLTVIAINKIDLVEKIALLPLFERLAGMFPGRSAELIPVSARSGDGIAELEQLLIGRLPEGDCLYPEDQVTDVSERFIASEVIREKLFGVLEQELPYSVAVTIESWEEQPKLLKIRANILVERESQKGIVIGKGGQVLKKIGERARLDLEKILDNHIFLELFVRVDDNWTETPAGLRRAGVVNG